MEGIRRDRIGGRRRNMQREKYILRERII